MSLLIDDLLGPSLAEQRAAEKPTTEAEFALAMLQLTEAGYRVEESAKTAGLSVTHAPIGKGGTNWITKSKPGNTGQLPAYIQNVRNAIMRGGKSTGKATAIAIGRIRTWASGGGGVHSEVKAAAAKAIAQFDAMRKKVGRSSSGAKKLAEELGVGEADLDTLFQGDEDESKEPIGDDADFSFDALLAQVRALPKAYPFLANVMTFFPAASAAAGSYPDDEGAENVIEAWGQPLTFQGAAKPRVNPNAPTRRATTTRAASSSGGPTTSRQRWAKYDSLHGGSSGAPVQGVQARVGVKQDGQYGAKTTAAVRKFQQKNGLQVDGVVGRQTFAALAGHKNASGVKVGKLSATQASQLANFAKHGGTLMTRSSATRRAKRLAAAQTARLHASLEEAASAEEVLADMLLEAERATHAEFPDRVKGLKQGEVARMPDGVAVKRFATQDGRDMFQVGDAARSGEPDYYGTTHRKADDAIKAARERSARSSDPESLGGETSFYRHDSVTADGKPGVFHGVAPDGSALVLHKGRSKPTSVSFDSLSGGSTLSESALEVADHFTPFS